MGASGRLAAFAVLMVACGGGATEGASDGGGTDAAAVLDGSATRDASIDADAREPIDSSSMVDARDASRLPCTFPGSPVVLASSQTDPYAIAADGHYAVWANRTAGTVMSCAVGGCGGAPTMLASGQGSPKSVAILGQNAFWGMDSMMGSGLAYCGLSGCGMQPTILGPWCPDPHVAVGGGWLVITACGSLFACDSTATCANHTNTPSSVSGTAIAADATSAYWFNYAGIGSAWQIQTCPFMGCNSLPAQVITTLPAPPNELAADGTNVYWSDQLGHVMTCGVGGCNNQPTTLATGFPASGVALAADGTSVYWTDYVSGTIMCCPAGGCSGSPAVIASGQGAPLGIAVDAAAVYWTNLTAGTVMRLAK